MNGMFYSNLRYCNTCSNRINTQFWNKSRDFAGLFGHGYQKNCRAWLSRRLLSLEFAVMISARVAGNNKSDQNIFFNSAVLYVSGNLRPFT